MAFREVRIREAHNRLVFRYDDERNVVEIMLHGQRFEVALDNYRSLHRRRDRGSIGVDFTRIEGEERTG